MAAQVSPTRSAPGPNPGLRGRVGDEVNVGVFHQGWEPSCSVSTAGYMCAILPCLASTEETALATGRSPYMFGAACACCGQHPKLNRTTLDGKCYAAWGSAYTTSSTVNRMRFCSHAKTKSNSSSMV